jgi:hypothetical protein
MKEKQCGGFPVILCATVVKVLVYPPAIAPMTINGSFPETTASGKGVSGDS